MAREAKTAVIISAVAPLSRRRSNPPGAPPVPTADAAEAELGGGASELGPLRAGIVVHSKLETGKNLAAAARPSFPARTLIEDMATANLTSASAKPAAGDFEPVIGLEVHVQLNTASKIFCSCSTRFGQAPNSATCPVCLGLPGALPVLNRAAVEKAVLAALALNCAVRERSIFARKNYFYPDLPKGYQISQYDQPLAEHGAVVIDERDEHGRATGATRTIGVTRLHLEEDAGKNVHEGFADADRFSYVDLNRAGVPLIEIVSEPDMRSPAEAFEYLTRLKEIMLYLGVSDCNMEEGSLRCDANVSVRPRGASEFGVKVEIKNLNSFRYAQRALEFEIARQSELAAGGGRVAQETRLFNVAENRTLPMRSKEEAHDYRYFPEPDLRPLVVTAAWREAIAAGTPELPRARRARLMAEFGLPAYDAEVLTANRALADYYEAAASGAAAAARKAIANWVLGDLSGWMNNSGEDLAKIKIPPAEIAALVALIESGAISGKMAKEVFARMAGSGEAAAGAVEALGLRQVSDRGALEAVIARVLAENPKQVEQFRAGKQALLGFFVGQVMKATRGQANPALVNELLAAGLSSGSGEAKA